MDAAPNLPSFGRLLTRWKTDAELAADLGVGVTCVRQMRRRGNIPEKYWAAIVASARRRRIDGISKNLLREIATTVPRTPGPRRRAGRPRLHTPRIG